LYCDRVPRSEEHPLPAALGEFREGPTLFNRICKQCNERRIGVLDEQLVRCGPIAVLRKRFGIQGRQHHEKVNPFYRGSAGGQRVKFLAWDEAFQCELLIELTGGNQGRQLTQLILRGASGPHHHIPLTASTTPKSLREQIAALKLDAPLELRLIYDPPNEQWAVDLFKELWPDEQLPQTTTGASGFKGGVVQFQTTNRYFRGIAKIGFHYFLTQFPEFTGHETFFDDVRDFIINDTKELSPDRINRFIGIHRYPITPPSPTFVGHLLCAEINRGQFAAHFEPFVTPSGRMQAFQIRLGCDSTVQYSALRSHLYLYFGNGKVGRFSGDAVRVDEQLLNSGVLQRSFVTDAFNEGAAEDTGPPRPD